MFEKFRASNINSVISSFEELRKVNKKCASIQTKAFLELQNWAIDSNNSAIQDVSCKFATLNCGIEESLRNDKIDALEKVIEMFKKFKEFDAKINDQNQRHKNAIKYEKKCLNEIRKCSPSKNIRDFEVKHMKAKQELEILQLKCEKFREEIEATKSILFKTNFKRYSVSMQRFNDSENIFFKAMKDLTEKIPDVSNEEVDDINSINYTKSAETDKICAKAKRRLQVVSSSRLQALNTVNRIEEIQPDTQVKTNIIEIENKYPVSNQKKVNLVKSRMSCPSKFEIKHIRENELYPCLESLMTADLELIPPPTYSDSESFHSNKNNANFQTQVIPSAPSQNQVISETARYKMMFSVDKSDNNIDSNEVNFEKSKQ